MIVERKGRILELPERIDPKHTALVVVDVQNDFLHPDGIFGRLGYDVSAAAPMVERLRALVESARRAQVLTIFVRASYDEIVLSAPFAETLNRRGHKDSHCLEETTGIDWFGGIEPRAAVNETIITKHRFSAFWGTSLDLYLRSNDVRTIIVTGVATAGCVESTARDGFFLNYFIVIPSDCVGDYSKAQQTSSLANLGKVFGTVTESGAIMSTWERTVSPERLWKLEAKRRSVLTEIGAKVAPEHTALILLDVQNDLCDPRGAAALAGEDVSPIQAALPAIRMLLGAARMAGVMVIHVKSEGDLLSASDVALARPSFAGRLLCHPGSWGAGFVEGVAPLHNEPIVVKRRLSPFPDSRLELLLRSNRIRTVVLAGAETHGGVESTARDACDRDFYVLVPRDAVASTEQARHLHDAALEVIGSGFGNVVACSELQRLWSEAKLRNLGSPAASDATTQCHGDIPSSVPASTKS